MKLKSAASAKTRAGTKRLAPVEEYMNPSHLDELKGRLLALRDECMKDIARANEEEVVERVPTPDEADLSDQRMEIENRARTMERLIHTKREIDAAIRRIEEGEYGYCEETGEEIGLERLRANPLARFILEVQDRREQAARMRGV